MSLGASLFSSVDISWKEFVEFTHSLPQRLNTITVSADLNSAFHEIGVKAGEGSYLVAVWKKHDSDPELLMEEASRVLGIPQQTLIQMDMNSYPLALEIVRVFAEHYPCAFYFGGHYANNQELLAQGT